MSQQIYRFIKFLEKVEGRKPPVLSVLKYGSKDELTEDVQLAAVQSSGNAIQFIENPSEKVKLAAVQSYGSAIKYIKNPSEDFKLAAVQKNGWVIRYIENPSEDIQLAAVQKNGYGIRYIKNPSSKVKQKAYETIMKRLGRIPDGYKKYFD